MERGIKEHSDKGVQCLDRKMSETVLEKQTTLVNYLHKLDTGVQDISLCLDYKCVCRLLHNGQT